MESSDEIVKCDFCGKTTLKIYLIGNDKMQYKYEKKDCCIDCFEFKFC